MTATTYQTLRIATDAPKEIIRFHYYGIHVRGNDDRTRKVNALVAGNLAVYRDADLKFYVRYLPSEVDLMAFDRQIVGVWVIMLLLRMAADCERMIDDKEYFLTVWSIVQEFMMPFDSEESLELV